MNYLSFYLTCLLTSGIFADALKIAGVTPVLKFDNLEENDNYKSVSVLSCFSQLIKRIIYNQISYVKRLYIMDTTAWFLGRDTHQNMLLMSFLIIPKYVFFNYYNCDGAYIR